MALSSHSKAVLMAALVLMSAGLLPAKADITAVNHCPYALTVSYLSQSATGTTSLTVPSGSSLPLGLPNPWIGGILWASQTSNADRAQCTQLEFNIGNGSRDYYDISLVNAYNYPAAINPTFLANGDVQSGLECGTPSCTIADINSVCQLSNFISGPDNACINNDGPGTVDTPSIDLFRSVCPNVYTQSNNNNGVVFACNTGSNYDAIWCP